MKDNFKFTFHKTDIHVATGMSENLVYRPKNILEIQQSLYELN